MTTLYKPVPIETAEQAEALPIGTVAQFKPGSALSVAAVKVGGPLPGWWLGDERVPVGAVPGYVALVAIEAEEETWEDIYAYGPHKHRYVTPWEDA